MKHLFVFLCVVIVASCGPVTQGETVFRSVIGSLVNCNSDLGLCMKEHALKAAERFSAARKLQIMDGITILNNSPKEGRSLESLSTDLELRNKQVTERLWESTSEILQSSELELSYGGSDDEESTGRALDEPAEESRGKKIKKKDVKKKLKLLIPLLLIAKAKAAVIVIISLVVIAASLFKLALIAKIAFIIKIIALIKTLLAKKHAEEEVGWQPHGWDSHAEHHSAPIEQGHGWEGGWSRSRNEANNLAYSAYGGV